MSIVIFTDTNKIKPWKKALKEAAPDINVLSYEEINDASDVVFALAWNHPKGIFSQYPRLRCISSMGAGVDHLIHDMDIPGHVMITRIIDPLMSQDLAEYILSVIMNQLRAISDYRLLQNQKKWEKKSSRRIRDVQTGIMGTGMIGHHVASFLQTCGFSVAGWGKNPGNDASYRRYDGPEQLHAFLGQTDMLVCLLPLTPATKGILNKNTLRCLPGNAFLINAGRGAHVVDQDLIDVIDSGHLSGACIDVFEQEPLPENHPFWSHPKIHITPHVASLTDPLSAAPQIIENYRRTMDHIPPLNAVDRNKGY
jgi:glyoxylate/hydroxypyruvate reductase